MTVIHVLDQQTANSIAAGEVVERPASVVKELVENALDAGASVISVEIRQGGISLIRVTDNGCGMSQDDALLAFARHATSKIDVIEDLDSIQTMGFRGEALASISAVSKVRLETREMDAQTGNFVQINGGEMLDSGSCSGPQGTSIAVEDLFYNIPARFKFLKKDRTEASAVTDVIERLALARVDVSFRLVSNQQEILHSPGNNDLISTVYSVYGRQLAAGCLPVELYQSPLKLSGLVGKPEIARGNRAHQSFYVNGRLVRSKAVTAALTEAYKTRLMKGKFAFAVLFLDVAPQLVDVNVHPQKMEVRFWNDSEVFQVVYHAVKNALEASGGISVETDDDLDEPTLDRAVQTPVQASLDDPKNSKETTPIQIEYKSHEQRLPVREQPVGDDSSIEQTPKLQTVQDDSVNRPQQVIQVNDLDRARLIGQVFRTYILMELDQDMILIDQHAAHEKIIYEQLLAQFRAREKQGFEVQELLVPLIIEVSRSELQLLKEIKDDMAGFGFDFDLFGSNSVALRSIPATSRQQLRPEAAFRATLEAYAEQTLDDDDQIADYLFTMACKAAVKAHDSLEPVEMKQLVEDLKKLDNPYQCPHGRPVIIRLTRHELEKRFKRIV